MSPKKSKKASAKKNSRSSAASNNGSSPKSGDGAGKGSSPAEHTEGPPEGCPAIRRVMMPRDTNAEGTIFGGVILAEIDLAAAVEAHHHHNGRIVTVAMDAIVFRAPVHVGDLVSFHTRTIRKGTSSVRVRVCVWAQRRFADGAHIAVTEAEVTMVATGKDGRPIPLGSNG